MSTWHVLAIERLGAPDPAWPTVYGPAAPGTDPIAANGLHTLDLTPNLAPVKDFTITMERDLTKSSFSSMSLDLKDDDGTLADALGPFSTTLAGATRYFGPWIQVTEQWGTSSAVRFTGYLDETSLQWSEDDARTQATILHASQLLRERLITDFPELLRPWPSVPTGTSQSFPQSTADALLAAVTPFTPRATAAAIEAGLWAAGQLTWEVAPSQVTTSRVVYHLDTAPTQTIVTATYPVPTALAASVIIGGQAYAVDHLAWDPDISADKIIGDMTANGTDSLMRPVRVYLQGAPNLTGLLHLGDTVTWGIPEAQRTHYLLKAGAIAAPASGSDGPKYVDLNTVEQLAVGDVLTLTFTDATSGTPRTVTADLPPIIDLDGEIGRAYLATALSQGYYNVSKVRRNSQDPVLFEGLAYAQALVAPFALDATQFAPAPTDLPVLAFRAYDVAAPSLYGAHNLQTTGPTGALRLARRGADNGTGAYPTAGIWQGAWGAAWSWLGQPTAEATHQILGDTLQFPGAAAPYTAPVLYIEGDLSGGATLPPNGWRPLWRSWQALTLQSQDPESSWNGSAITWAPVTASGDVPALLVAYAATTPTPGRYTLAAGAWSFQAHTADATLATATTPTLTGSLPSGNPLALGMGIWAPGSADEQEALLALVATGSAYPFTAMSAALLSQAAGGVLTVQQTAALWATGGAIPAGPWALGGGLVVQTWTETIGGVAYPHTVLTRLTGSATVSASLKTLEVIPATVVPLHLTGTAGARVVSGWYCLALETYLDANFAPARRLRFVHLDASLTVLNGDPEPDPSVPTDITAYFLRGEVVASIMPDGAILARMVRTSAATDTMAGLVGGRLFTVANQLPSTVERLKLNATIPQGQILDVAHSGDGMAVADYLEKFAGAQMATAVPGPEGGMALVSRALGTLRLRAEGAQYVSVLPTERGKVTKTQAWQGYLRRVRVTYTDLLAASTATVEVAGTFDGGALMDLDVSDLVCSLPMSRAIGRAVIYWMGPPAPVRAETWTDRTGGTAGALAPPWWADWRIGDQVTLTPAAALAPATAWKLIKMQPALEDRAVQVELRQQPFPITIPLGGGL